MKQYGYVVAALTAAMLGLVTVPATAQVRYGHGGYQYVPGYSAHGACGSCGRTPCQCHSYVVPVPMPQQQRCRTTRHYFPCPQQPYVREGDKTNIIFAMPPGQQQMNATAGHQAVPQYSAMGGMYGYDPYLNSQIWKKLYDIHLLEQRLNQQYPPTPTTTTQ